MKERGPAETHRLPALPGAPQACRRPSVEQLRWSFSHGCITVEPAVGVAAAPPFRNYNQMGGVCIQVGGVCNQMGGVCGQVGWVCV